MTERETKLDIAASKLVKYFGDVQPEDYALMTRHSLRIQGYTKLMLIADTEPRFRNAVAAIMSSAQALMSIPDEAITNTFQAIERARIANAVAGDVG